MEVIQINLISRYLKKHIQFYKINGFGFQANKKRNMLEALNWDLKLGAVRHLTKMPIYYVLPFARNLFLNF